MIDVRFIAFLLARYVYVIIAPAKRA